MRRTDHKYRNKSLLKALSIIDCFTIEQPELSAAEVARKVGMPNSTAHRILMTLAQGRFLERNGKAGKYSIGPSLYAKGSLYLGTTDIISAADPVVKTLNDLTNETVNVSIREKSYITLIMREESKYGFRWSVHIGSNHPAHASSQGKILLSELSKAEIDALYPEEKLPAITGKTITSKAVLELELEQTRNRGVAFASESFVEGIESVAAGIRDKSGKIIAAMSIATPIFRLDKVRREKLAELVAMGASLVSYRLGYQGKEVLIRDIEEIRSWWEKNKVD